MRNPSTTVFDAHFLQIPRLSAMPAMLPYVGGDYESPNHKRLLLVGESYYFPEDSTIHQDMERWYDLTQQSLTDEEVMYINCRGLVQCDWESPGHKMYRELNSCLDSLALPGSDRAISQVAFMNLFFRPALIPGESFRHCCQDKDREEAKGSLRLILDILKPNLVVFCSKYAWDSVGSFISFDNSLQADFVSHPTDPFHWNVASYRHGKKKFMGILKDHFLI